MVFGEKFARELKKGVEVTFLVGLNGTRIDKFTRYVYFA
jgi:hypothetical protein